MQYNKFISRSPSRSILFYGQLALLLPLLFPGSNGSPKDILNSEDIVNHRAPKQFFSILKNILQQAQKPQIQPKQEDQQLQQQQQQFQNPYYNQFPVRGSYFPAAEQKIQLASGGGGSESYIGGIAPASNNDGTGLFSNQGPNYLQSQSQYPMQNYQHQQHSSVPFYNDNLQLQAQQQQIHQQFAQPQQIPGGSNSIGGFGSSSSISPVLLSQGINMLSKLGLGNLGIPGDLDLSTVANLINFGAFEGILGRVNQFDKLQCIPKMICQMVAKRNEDQALRDSTSTTTSTTTTTERTRSTKKPKKRTRQQSARFIKIGGVDTALEQFVQFLDVMQLKDWSIYPYVKGMSEGNQVQRSGDCTHKFSTCPFSDDQLVYYFNNYNGGLFQSVRSGRDLIPDSNGKIRNVTAKPIGVKL